MFEGYLSFGGNELVNSARSVGYVNTSECGVSWLQCPPCDGIPDALGETLGYTYDNIEDAPWYDVEDPATHRFLGVTGLRVEGITDSTRSAEVAESIGNGGVVSRPRHGTRRVRVEATLTAQGEDALEAGLAWLNAALIPRDCSAHGSSCGQADVKFFTACPPERSEVVGPSPIWNDPITNLATNPSFETAGAAVELFRNLVTNPSFEATTASTVEVRRNQNLNPRLANDNTGWGSNAANYTLTATAAGAQIDVLALAGQSNLINQAALLTAAVGEYWSASMEVTVPAGYPAADVWLAVWAYGPEKQIAQSNNGTSITVQPGQTVTIQAPSTLAVPAGTTGLRSLLYGRNVPVGGRVVVKNALIEKSNVLGTYFDGSTLPAGDFTHAWTGTANASASVQYGIAVVGGISTSSATTAVIQSTAWASSGAVSMRIIPKSENAVTRAYVQVPSPMAGKLITVQAKIRLAAPLTGTLDGSARTFRIFTDTGSGYVNPVTAPAAPNAAGVYTLTASMTVDAAAVGLRVYLYNGASAGGGDVWWDDLLVIEGNYTGPYFDGSSVIYDPDITTAWVGTPHASASVRNAVGVVSVSVGAGGLAIHSTEWTRSRVKSLRVIPSGKGGTDSYVNVGGSTGGFRFGMQPDHTYTVMAHLHLDTPQVGVLYQYARTIRAYFKVDGAYVAVSSAQAPNVPGDYGLTLTFTVPWNATEAFIRIYNGSDDVTDNVWFDDFLFIEGDYDGPYFDGESPDSPLGDFEIIGMPLTQHEWTGTAEASTSTRANGMVIAVEDPERWQKIVESLTRYMHTSTAVSGPTIVQKLHRGENWGYIVEFVLVSAVGWTFGVTRPVTGADNPSIPSVIQDTPFNLVPYPSAELTSGTVIAATNYATNPSVEANGTGWTTVTDGTQITQAQVSLLPSTELKAVGAQSIKALFTATATSTNGWFGTQQIVTLTGIMPTTRYSINMWTVSSVESGTAVLGDLEIHAYWRNDAAVTLLDQTLYKGSSDGGATSVPSILPPAGTTNVVVRAFQRVTSWSTGAKIRLYADALAVTMP